MYTPTTKQRSLTLHKMLEIPQTNARYHQCRMTALSQMSKVQEWLVQYVLCMSSSLLTHHLLGVYKTYPFITEPVVLTGFKNQAPRWPRHHNGYTI